MITKGLTSKVLIGMLLGAIVGIVLMYMRPVPYQPKDVVDVTLGDGSVQRMTVSDVLASSETSANGGSDGDVAVIAGLDKNAAIGSLNLAGVQATDIRMHDRNFTNITILPFPTNVVHLVGDLFMRLLKMIIIPLIIATILVGIASLGDLKKLGGIGKQALLFYFSTMIVATGIGITLVNIIGPGRGLEAESFEPVTGAPPTVPELLLRLVPTNPFEALSTMNVLQILFFTIILGVAVLKIGKSKAAPFFNFFESLNDLIFVLISWIMVLAPVGVGCLLAYFLGVQSPEFVGDLLGKLGKFALCVTLGLTIHFCLLTFLVRWLGKVSPLGFIRTMMPAIVTALGTDSSSATMPVTMTCVREAGVSKRIAGFVVPVGATANMDGTALYEATAVLFFAQYFRQDLTIAQQFIVAFTAMAAAVGAAGIPSAGLVTMVLVLTAVGLPDIGVGMLLAIDRPLDMMRTVVNVYGDAVTSRVVQTWNPDIKPEEDDLATEYEPVVAGASHGD